MRTYLFLYGICIEVLIIGRMQISLTQKGGPWMDPIQMKQTKISGRHRAFIHLSLILTNILALGWIFIWRFYYLLSVLQMIDNSNQIFSYLPFGGGPRKCVGDMFATYEVTLLLKIKFHNFRSFISGMKIIESYTLLICRL